MSDKDKEWLEAMLEDREKNRRLYDALAKEHLPERQAVHEPT